MFVCSSTVLIRIYKTLIITHSTRFSQILYNFIRVTAATRFTHQLISTQQRGRKENTVNPKTKSEAEVKEEDAVKQTDIQRDISVKTAQSVPKMC